MQRIPPRASRTEDYPFGDDDSYYSERLPTRAIRYTDTRGNQVVQRGNSE